MPNALFEDFPPVSTAEWEEAIRKDLKGADYDKRLVWHTSEGIAVKPYYRREDLDGLEWLTDSAPGVFPYARDTRETNDWKIREWIDDVDCSKANHAARKALAAGAEEIAFRRAAPLSPQDLHIFLEGLEKVAIHFDAQSPALIQLLVGAALPVRGSMNLHPFRDAETAASLMRTTGTDFRPVTLNAASFLEAGGDTVQELAFTLAAGIEYLRQMNGRSIPIDRAAHGITFSFAIGSSYFFQIAKLRAFRLLWARAVESFGGSKEAAKAVIDAHTAEWNQTIYDSYNNALRGTTEAMSAAIGGVDSMSVEPFDQIYREPSDASRRLARNTQIILKKEAWLDRVADPGAGSYYIEVLTDSLARAAWKMMQDLESSGGYIKGRDGGMIPGMIAEAREKKEAALARRRSVLVGTNNYVNLRERKLEDVHRTISHPDYGRAAEPYENIRLRTERHAAAGHKTPRLLLAEMGDLKMRKARSAFVLNFFGCAGFEIRVQDFESPDTIASGAREFGADAVVLCSSDDEYSALAGPVVQALNGTPVIVAGNPKNADELKRAGVADFVHIKSNAIHTLSAWQDRLEVRG